LNVGPIIVSLLALAGSAASQPRMLQSRAVLGQWATYYAVSYHVPVDLVNAIIEEESRWNPYAVSNKGAAGVMQLMPGTARRFGVRNRFRGDDNIRGGVAYLAWLMRQFQGDLRLVTAAYYVGEVTIRARGLDYSSADVHGYVERVARRYRIALANKAQVNLIAAGGEPWRK
jgi:soluble lytic murein transglycosylase-like protein